MVSLVDIVPQTRTVQIAGGELVLRGLGLRQIASLLLRFPEFRKYLGNAAEIDPDVLLLQIPGCIGAIIAAAADQPDAEEAIEDRMSLEDLAQCLVVIRDLTMPSGADPLVKRLAQLLGAPADTSETEDHRGEVLDMNSPKRLSA
jgi:hypothetical protein